ncbi:MAG: hypothetical protein N4A74_01195, partial [Carboxylicivirga sp.]|nr:hypothetical protein [Carboxylicivirga sp.]
AIKMQPLSKYYKHHSLKKLQFDVLIMSTILLNTEKDLSTDNILMRFTKVSIEKILFPQGDFKIR